MAAATAAATIAVAARAESVVVGRAAVLGRTAVAVAARAAVARWVAVAAATLVAQLIQVREDEMMEASVKRVAPVAVRMAERSK